MMAFKKFWLWYLISLANSGCFAQNQPPTAYADYIDTLSAKKHLQIIASDAFEGRETGKRGAERAAQYIATQFESIGLTAPVNHTFFQSVKLTTTKFYVDHFQIGTTPFHSGKDFLIIQPAIQQHIRDNQIVCVGYGKKSSEQHTVDFSIRNKVVLLIDESKVSKHGNNQHIQNLLSQKPKLILSASATADSLLKRVKEIQHEEIIRLQEDVASDTINSQAETPVVYISAQTANRILASGNRTLQQFTTEMNRQREPINFRFDTHLDLSFGIRAVPVKAQNVLGYMEGTDLKNELLIITAHYDHIGINPDGQINNGADDDGSGVTGVLEIAKAFSAAKKNGQGPRRSILFMTVTGEEKGLLGSDYYTRHPIFPLASTIANLNIDMIGRIDPRHTTNPNYVYLVGSDKLSSTLHQISETANSQYTKLQLDYKYNDPTDPERIYYRSDHYNFAKHNIPVIFYFNGVHADYHDIGDTVDKIDFNLLTRRAKLVFYTAWDLANRDQRPLVDANKK